MAFVLIYEVLSTHNMVTSTTKTGGGTVTTFVAFVGVVIRVDTAKLTPRTLSTFRVRGVCVEVDLSIRTNSNRIDVEGFSVHDRNVTVVVVDRS